MKPNNHWIIAVATLLLLALTPASSAAMEKVDIAMVLWRGLTEAEKGFQAKLISTPKYDFTFTTFDANQDSKQLAKIIDQLDMNRYKLIYSFGTTVTKKLKSRISGTPIVFNIVSRPVKAGIINSWDHSGGNITGASNAVPVSSTFNSLSKVLYIGRLGFMYNPKEANSQIQRNEVDKLQRTYGYNLIDAPVTDTSEIPSVIKNLLDAKVDAVLLPSDSFIKASADHIIPLLNQNKIPSIVSIPAMVRDNKAFLGLGPDYHELGKMAAGKALAILNGRHPSDVPSSTLDRLHMTVNLTTAKEIGVSVPVQILRICTVVR